MQEGSMDMIETYITQYKNTIYQYIVTSPIV